MLKNEGQGRIGDFQVDSMLKNKKPTGAAIVFSKSS